MGRASADGFIDILPVVGGNIFHNATKYRFTDITSSRTDTDVGLRGFAVPCCVLTMK